MKILPIPAISSRGGKSTSALRWSVVVMMVAGLLSCGSATDARAQIYRGKVVDAETGQPLEGAVFAVVWSKKPRVTMDGPEYFHSATEALTDAKGEFSVDGSPGVDWNPFTYIVNRPSVGIFMPGYAPFPTGHVKEIPREEMVKGMIGAGVVIKLPKLKNQQEMRRYTSPGTLEILSDTPHEAMPNLMRAINIHRKLAGLSS